MKQIKRDIEKQLLTAAKYFPTVTILGPRQSGKTTLARMIFPDYTYINLEDPEYYNLADNDINAFFAMLKGNTIIDEIQRLPKLLSKIQVIVDEKKINGQFILTGSFQQGLKSAISQSLAGRTAVLKLLPLSVNELLRSGYDLSKDDYIYRGFMPRHYAENQPVGLLYSSYIQTYVERDVQTILNVKNKNLFDKFIRLLAGRIGQVINCESLSNDVGVSVSTISQWISVLESSFIIFRLEPYYKNYTKRLIKSCKIYFCDIGLVSYLLGIRNAEQAERDPLIGNLFENMIILEMLKTNCNFGTNKNLFFFRDSKGFEIDAIIDDGNSICPVEIKSASTYNRDFASNLKKFINFADNAKSPTVIYSGDIECNSEGINYKNFKNTKSLLVE